MHEVLNAATPDRIIRNISQCTPWIVPHLRLTCTRSPHSHLHQASQNELTNGVINAAFMLLFKDLIRLFACYNDGIINLLGRFCFFFLFFFWGGQGWDLRWTGFSFFNCHDLSQFLFWQCPMSNVHWDVGFVMWLVKCLRGHKFNATIGKCCCASRCAGLEGRLKAFNICLFLFLLS